MIRGILGFVLMITSLNSNCQTGFGYRNGIIVTQTNDTINCLVPVASSFSSKVSIKKNVDSDPETMSLGYIKYLATSTNLYENIGYLQKGKENHKLMWLEIEGKMNLYLELDDINHGSIPVRSGNMIFRQNIVVKTYVIKKAGMNYLIEKNNFIDSILPIISETPDLISKVNSKAYNYENIEDLIKEYNRITQ